MKKIIVLFLLVGFTLTSCEDYLDSTNYTEANTSNFPTSASDVSQMLAALYAVMNQLQNDPLQAPWFMTEIMSDNCYGSGGTGDNECKAIHHFTLYSSTQYDGMWKLYYRGIYRANTIIETVDNADWDGDTNARNQALGEAYFMRSLFYLWATQSFGDIPLITSANVPDYCPEVSAETEIYPQIFSDLVSAMALMNTQSDGHANKYAAEALLARAYLFYEGFYKKVEDISNATPEAIALIAQEGVSEGQTLSKSDVIDGVEDCIENGGYSLVSDYRNLWQYTNELTVEDYDYTKGQGLQWAGNGNSEEIFMVQYMNASSWSASEYYMAYSNESALYCGLRLGTDTSGRQNGMAETFPFGCGWGMGGASANIWNDWTEQEVTDGETDVRKMASVLSYDEELADTYAYVNDCSEDAGFSMKKIIPITCKQNADGSKVNAWTEASTWWAYLDGYSGSSNGSDMQGAHYADTYLIRLADVYLMHSELTGDVTYLNRVRSRAGLSALSSYSLEALQKERRWELCFEGLRYNDMRRWSGIDCDADSYICEMLDAQAGQRINVCGEWTTMKHMTSSWSSRYMATNGFLPKPATQIELANGALIQNEGWDSSDASYVTIY
ncbi:MAG: RagB/SusD family nutrient uptake outer membrane protein [Bacteroides sp.]|nr:RagB/SusD family nutrient uptake outer membrane protein [Bacteroides sp.]